MKDEDKTKEQLIRDVSKLRQRNAELERAEAERRQAAQEGNENVVFRLDLEGAIYDIVQEHKRTEEAPAGEKDDGWGFVKRAREELKRSHERFAAVMDSLNTDVYVMDMETQDVLFANKHARDAFEDEDGNIRWEDLQRDSRGEEWADASEEMSEGHIWEFEDKSKDRWYELHNRAIRWVDDRIVRLEIATDITERKRSEEALLEHERRLASVETLRQMLMTLSHHINNAMTAIYGRAQLCGMGSASSDQLVELCLVQTKRISAVLSALDRMVKEMDIRTTDYVGIRNAMFDIEEELKGMLEGT